MAGDVSPVAMFILEEKINIFVEVYTEKELRQAILRFGSRLITVIRFAPRPEIEPATQREDWARISSPGTSVKPRQL